MLAVKKVYQAICVACVGWLMLAVASCDNDKLPSDVIATNEIFVLTGDSLICKDYFVTAISPYQIVSSTDSVQSWSLTSPLQHVPQFASNELMITALYNHGLWKLAATDWNKLSTGQLAAAVSLAMVYVNPSQAIGLLQSRVRHGEVVNDGEGYLGWAFAAWEVYKATGNRQWLMYAYDVTKNTVQKEYELYFDTNLSLMRGDIPQWELTTVHSPYEKWMNVADAYNIMPLIKNTFYCVAYGVLAQMGEELEVAEDEVASYATSWQILKDAINQNLWNEDNGYYSNYLYYTSGFQEKSSGINMVAQALNVMWNIADDGRAETLISCTPISDLGIAAEYFANELPQSTLPADACAQVLMGIAAAKVENQNVLRRCMASLVYNTIRDGLASPSALTATANVAVVMKVLLGIEYLPEGIEFNPIVPPSMKAKKTLTEFKYRGATLNVTIVGTGDKVESISIDGKRCESNFLPSSITGTHTVTVKMFESKNTPQKVTRAKSNQEIISAVIKKSRLKNQPKIECEDKLKVPCSSLSISGDEGRLQQMINVEKSGVYAMRVFYSTDTTLAIEKVPFAKVFVNTHKQGVVALPAQKNNADSLFSNSVMIELLKGENSVCLKFSNPFPKNIKMKELRIAESE